MADDEDPKSALVAELNRAREQLSVHAQGARAHANPGTKLRASFSHHRVAWISAAALIGLVLAKLPARTKKVVVDRQSEGRFATVGKTGLALGALKLVFDLAKPFVMAWATNRLGDLAQKSQHSYSRKR